LLDDTQTPAEKARRRIDNLYSPPSGRKKEEEKNNNNLTKLNYYNIHSTISSRN